MTLPSVLPPLGLEGIVLKPGGHKDRSNGLCALEIVSWLAGEPHSDHPQCACPVIGAFMRSWNDNISDDETRTKLLRPLLPLLIGTRSTKAVELKRSYLAVDWLARECAPAWLSLRDDLKAHTVALRGLAPLTDSKSCKAAQTALDGARSAAAVARAAARDAAEAAAGDAAEAAAGAAAGAAARAAAWDAAWAAAAWDAAWAARDAARAAAARDAAWAARDAARAAAGAALAPTVTALQASAVELVKRMAAVRDE